MTSHSICCQTQPESLIPNLEMKTRLSPYSTVDGLETQRSRVGRSNTIKAFDVDLQGKGDSEDQMSLEGDDGNRALLSALSSGGKQFPPNPLTMGLTESKETLLGQIRAINRQLGRDLSACLRPLPMKKDNYARQGLHKRATMGFQQIEKSTPQSHQHYLKSLRSEERAVTESCSQRVLSPSQQTFMQLKEALKLRRTTMSERQTLKAHFDSQLNAVKAKIEGNLGKEMENLNRNGIFPSIINEVRATTSLSVKVETHTRSSARVFLLKEKEKMMEERKLAPSSKHEVMVLSEEEQKKQEAEKRKLLLDHLEDKLVDKIARAERKAKVSDDLGIIRLTSEQIEAKLAKMKAESLKRQKPVMIIRSIPVLDIAQGSRRLAAHAAGL